MNPSRSLGRSLVAGALALAGTVGATASVAEAGRSGPDVAGKIAVEEGHKVFLVGHAVGVQIYSCNPSGSGFAWGLVAPQAVLYGDNGKVLAEHYGGPTWETRDGSTVKARRVDGVTVDPTAIPWLLLEATSTAAGPDGDRLTRTTFIQRTATTGGMAPADGCEADTVGDVVEIPYTADYHFWKSTGN
jgi:hypothetical protein